MKRLLLSICFVCIAILSLAQAKYVFYFIGDGMGPTQILAAEMYRAELEGKIDRVPLLMTQFPNVGLSPTFSATNGITDSSAAGTTLASGNKAKNGTVGLLPDGTPVKSIAKRLYEDGWGVGVVTTVQIDHATPSPFYANGATRYEFYSFGRQLAESGFHFFGGAGFHQPNGADNQSPNLYDYCEKMGYFLAGGYETAMANTKKERVILLPKETIKNRSIKSEALPYAIDRQEGDLHLEQLVDAAIANLSKHEQFFLMIEGGKIDYAGHGNDAATAIHEVIDFDNAIAVAYRFYQEHPDETLIVVAADHETGGMVLGNSDYTLNLQVLQYQTQSSGVISDGIKQLYQSRGEDLTWEDVQKFLSDNMGLYDEVKVSDEDDTLLRNAFNQTKSNQGEVKTLYKDINALASTALKILNRYAHIGWTTHSHSATAVPIFAIGAGAEKFTGWHDNTKIAPMIYDSTR